MLPRPGRRNELLHILRLHVSAPTSHVFLLIFICWPTSGYFIFLLWTMSSVPHFVLNLMMKNSEDRLFLSWKRAYAKLRHRAYDSLMVIFINGNAKF